MLVKYNKIISIIGVLIAYSVIALLNVKGYEMSASNYPEYLPKIEIIKTYFEYKVKLFDPSKYLMKNIVEEVANKEDENKLLQDYLTYFPTPNMEVPGIVGQITTVSILGLLDSLFPEKIDTIFEVSNNDKIAPTSVIEGPLLDSRLPIEAPVEIKVKEDTQIRDIIAYQYRDSLAADKLNSIMGPSYEGPAVYNDNAIFHMHLEIVDIIKNQLNLHDMISEAEARKVIKDIVIEYLNKFNIYSQLTSHNLRDTNFVINLLIKEFVANSLFVEDVDRVIMQNIINTLIIESISPSSDALYDDPLFFHSTLKIIIARFL